MKDFGTLVNHFYPKWPTLLINTSLYSAGPDQIIPSDVLKTWEPSGAVKLNISEEGVASHRPISVPTVLKKTAEK